MVLGLALAVSSTVVLVRCLSDNGMLDTVHGHVAVGWLIVQDVLTVFVLVFLPMMTASFVGGDKGFSGLSQDSF